MNIELTLLIIIAGLLGYIIYLHIHLTKKNLFITSTVERLSVIEKSRSIEEMMSLLEELQKHITYSSYFKDKFPDENTISFISENESSQKVFMHYTRDESDALKIMKEGFLFAESFYRTALPVTGDILDMRIKHSSRKYFGDYLIVICIDNKIVDHYARMLELEGVKNHTFENILTELPPQRNENGDQIFRLPPQFIKGYINHRTAEIVKNPSFNPGYDSPMFEANITSLKFF
jgi:hypothetical protein